MRAISANKSSNYGRTHSPKTDSDCTNVNGVSGTLRIPWMSGEISNTNRQPRATFGIIFLIKST